MYARPKQVVRVAGDVLVVGLDRLSIDFGAFADGAVAVVDPDAGSVTAFDLVGLASCGRVVPVPGDPAEVLVDCAGYGHPYDPEVTPRTSGLVLLDTEGDPHTVAELRAALAPALGGALSNAIAIGGSRALAVVTRADGGPDELVLADLESGSTETLLASDAAYVLGVPAVFEASGLVLVPDARAGVRRLAFDGGRYEEIRAGSDRRRERPSAAHRRGAPVRSGSSPPALSWLAVAAVAMVSLGCADEGTVAYADTVIEAPGATGEGFRDASRAVNGVRGAGDSMGSLDVFSLGYTPGEDDHIVLRWAGQRVTDGPGADVVVFENAFVVTPGSNFIDAAIVEVSRDGTTWVAFPHDYRAEDDGAYSSSPGDWLGFAGVTPVRLDVDANPVDPFDAEAAGGDAFDLATLPSDDPEALAIREEGLVFLRIVSAHARIDPDTGEPYPAAAISDGPDIDGVYGRWLAAE